MAEAAGKKKLGSESARANYIDTTLRTRLQGSFRPAKKSGSRGLPVPLIVLYSCRDTYISQTRPLHMATPVVRNIFLLALDVNQQALTCSYPTGLRRTCTASPAAADLAESSEAARPTRRGSQSDGRPVALLSSPQSSSSLRWHYCPRPSNDESTAVPLSSGKLVQV